MPNKKKSLKAMYNTEYCALMNAVDRCTRHSHSQSKDYVKRGLTVESAWRCPTTGFAAFLDEVGPKPSPDLELDRIDNDLGYVRGNVRWISHRDNMANRRKQSPMRSLGWGLGERILIDIRGNKRAVPCQLVPYDGKLTPLPDVAAILGIRVTTLRQRIQKGWKLDRVFAPILYSPIGKPRIN